MKPIVASINKLENWIDNNGLAGYDPYDLRGTEFYQNLVKTQPGRRLAVIIERFFPLEIRKLLLVKPQINAKAIALLALGKLARFKSTRQENYRQEAIELLSWLEQNTATGYPGSSWGYPFDWYTLIKIPQGTPSAVVSSTVGYAYLTAYRLLGDPAYLEMARSIAHFFHSSLRIYQQDSARICFSYTPIDKFHVHNANLLVAAHLFDIGNLTGEPAYLETARQAVNYTVSSQNPDGSWFYWGPPDNYRFSVDHYHTGFVLRCLDRICQYENSQMWLDSLYRGLDYYRSTLFDPNGIPKLTPQSLYPIDIHCCSEAILCLSQLYYRDELISELLEKTTCWVLENMQALDGHFYYSRYSRYSVRIAYLRWGQAWMYWALAELASLCKELQK